MKLILSSSSPARQQLLSRLQLPFEVITPDIDETPLLNETATQLVKRLAKTKAQVHAPKFPDALIIGCDQVSVMDNEIINKPETHENAVKQLLKSSGKHVVFHTGLCLYNTKTEHTQVEVETFDVFYRQLSPDTIEKYLQRDKPYHCAGSIRAEGLGVVLFERITGKDPSTLTGLPLIRLVRMLENEDVQIL